MVGALVLVSLAVIFIPMILTGQGSLDMGHRGPTIPHEPDLKFPDKIIDQPVAAPVEPTTPRVTVLESDSADAPEPAPQSPDKVIDTPVPVAATPPQVTVSESGTADEKEAEAARRSTAVEQKMSTPTTAVATTKSEEAAPVQRAAPAWAVQVGSFANKTSAFTLRDQLRAKKFAAYVEAVSTATGRVYRVRVGPELKPALAEALQARIAKDTGQKGIVVSHR